MPQLNPAPWLMIFILIWTFLFVFLNKVLHSVYPNSPSMKQTKKAPFQHWNWPWL